jgi:hypothetical protein
MRQINTVLLKLAKRAETYNRRHLIESFVDVGPLFTLLSNPDNQVLFGRRGTGKTHVLGYLANEVQRRGTVAVMLDMRTVGSTGGIYADVGLAVSERATRLLVDTLCAIHDQIVTAVLDHSEEYNLAVIGPVLDRFVEAATTVVVQGVVEREESYSSEHSEKASRNLEFDLSPSEVGASFGRTSERDDRTNQESRTKREGAERLRVHFGAVGTELARVVQALPNKQLWIVMDEWSEVPLDLQPYVADLLRRTVLPVQGVTVKIAAIEQRCRFRIPDESVGHIGIEIGADLAASINLDEFLVFENNPELAKRFFQELLHRHVRALVTETKELRLTDTSVQFVSDTFTQGPAFDEFVRSAEGVPRDGINIIGIAAQRALDNAIGVPDIRVAARTWYSRAKQQAVSTKPRAQELLNWIVDKVIQHRRAKAFLLESEIRDALIDFLYDARVLHVIRMGISGGDIPGRRFNVYSLDYGCYVDLINTTRAPQGLLNIDGEDRSGYVDVPQTDFRSIRRAILDLGLFYDGRSAGDE